MSAAPIPTYVVLERASTLCDLNRWSEVERLMTSVIAGDPQNSRALCFMAQALLMQGRNEESLRSARAAIACDPDDGWGYRLASMTLTRLRQHDQAIAMARAAVRLGPEDLAPLTILARALVARGGELFEARAVADRAVVLGPNVLECHLAVGVVAAADGRREDAERAFRQCLSMDPEHSGALNDLARLQLKHSGRLSADRLAEAADGFATAARADPTANVSRQNLDVVVHVFLTRANYGIFIAAIIAGRVPVTGTGAWWRVVPTLVVIVPIVFAARFVSRLRPHLRAYLWRFILRPTVALAVIADVVAVAGLVVGAISAADSSVAFGVAGLAAVLARLILWVRRRRTFA